MILARSGIKLKILPSAGSLENLKRLGNPAFRVDIGFVQAGVTNGIDTDNLVSLGSVANEPLLIFYHSTTPLDLLSELNGKRLAIGPVGSGTRPSQNLRPARRQWHRTRWQDGAPGSGCRGAASQALLTAVDAVFLMSDSASTENMRDLLVGD